MRGVGFADVTTYDLLGGVEVTYHPILALLVVTAVHLLAAPVPGVTLAPVGLSSEGTPLTLLVAAVVVVDLLSDLLSLSIRGGDGG